MSFCWFCHEAAQFWIRFIFQQVDFMLCTREINTLVVGSAPSSPMTYQRIRKIWTPKTFFFLSLNLNKVVFHSVMRVKVADKVQTVEPGQTVLSEPSGEVWSGSTLFVQTCLYANLRSIWYLYNIAKKKKKKKKKMPLWYICNSQQILRAMSSKFKSRDFGRFPIPTLAKITSLDCVYEVWKYMYICRFNIESKCHVEPSLGENHHVLKEAIESTSK